MITNILQNKSVWKILLLYSYAEGSGYRWVDLKTLTGLHIASLRSVLRLLEFYKIIVKKNMIYKLNVGNIGTQLLIELIEKEKIRLNYPSFELYLQLISFLEEIQKNEKINKVKEVYLFGSCVKKKASKNSDIDIAIISDDISLQFNKEVIKLEEKEGIEFQVIILKELATDSLSLEIKRHGVQLV